MLHFFKKNLIIGLDVDDVLADFVGSYKEHTNTTKDIYNHYFSYKTLDVLNSLDMQFWLDLKPKINGFDLPFLPSCYISRRNFPTYVTEEWLEKNHFPCLPVVHVHGSKLEACKKLRVDLFVDDFIQNFQELNAGGVRTLLLDCDHNRQYDVEDHRLKDLYELPKKATELFS